MWVYSQRQALFYDKRNRVPNQHLHGGRKCLGWWRRPQWWPNSRNRRRISHWWLDCKCDGRRYLQNLLIMEPRYRVAPPWHTILLRCHRSKKKKATTDRIRKSIAFAGREGFKLWRCAEWLSYECDGCSAGDIGRQSCYHRVPLTNAWGSCSASTCEQRVGAKST